MTFAPRIIGLRLAGEHINDGKVRVLARFDAVSSGFILGNLRLVVYPDGTPTVWAPRKQDGVAPVAFDGRHVRDAFRDAALPIFEALGGVVTFEAEPDLMVVNSR